MPAPGRQDSSASFACWARGTVPPHWNAAAVRAASAADRHCKSRACTVVGVGEAGGVHPGARGNPEANDAARDTDCRRFCSRPGSLNALRLGSTSEVLSKPPPLPAPPPSPPPKPARPIF
eukprot:6153783-Prymnesium_polylepis.1